MSNIQSRKYQLTINNPKEYGLDHDRIIEILNSFNLIYYALCDEIGKKEGTYHTHIYMCSSSPIRFTTIQRRFGGIPHIETAHASSYVNRQYLLKEGKFETKSETSVDGTFYEWGDIPSEKEEKYPLMTRVMEDLKKGKTIGEIIEEHPNLGFKTNEIETLRQTLLSEKYSKENRDVKCVYVCGKTGLGKTYGVYKEHDMRDVCRITNYNRLLFDSYRGQAVLVLEEYRSQIPISEILNLLDIYPLELSARYRDRVACYTKVYIISNLPIEEQYKNIQQEQPETWNAFLRRIETIRVYTEKGVYTDYPCEAGGFLPCL